MTTHLLPQRGRLWLDGVARTLKKKLSGILARRSQEHAAPHSVDSNKALKQEEHQLSEDETIDQNSEDSFPASDPPSWSGRGLR